ncbi:hypothetical protein COU78_01025 [Candidatus Peregrinibacteria bacterium CG10_big_fil_rev_8_21_14_0_10_49_24]|nr:MAG: hypothetical protein COV83_01275 [Candidatus Peregrinibacteria bacterium CG11_big_fil_rev_8_21_14_0_20_49_14]PIR51530.1 MAG: hypothetical protein COU78_01025 [Candidatus Peregrinibacteria bacterium CG10_big_fil_rev_8_21_14_0_10_49_24]PJA67827.1 MAG: hypothetical protein CO157_02315 [Candidatus Peregrinibacteria bacterium CG_4_9_14_3_um_filter_49_12]
MLALSKGNRLASPLHFRRIEMKFLLPDRLIPALIDRIAPYTQPDPFLVEEGKGRTKYPVTSLYFDSVDMHSFYEKDAGLLSRRKVRLRTYEEEFSEESYSFLEIKRRHDFVVSKDRLSLSVGQLHSSLPMAGLMDHLLKRVEASEEVTNEAHVLQGWYNLQPTALVSYMRQPFVGMQDRRFRITVDSNLKGVWKPRSLMGAKMYTNCHPGWSVVEIKSNHAIPAWFHDIIMDFELTRTAHSKYALCVRCLRERLT